MVILIVDDEAGVRNSLFQAFKKRHEVVPMASGEEAIKEIEKRHVDVVITDFQMPGLSGIDLIRKGRELSPSTSFLLMTAFGTIEQAVEAIHLGAEDYFLKPFDLSEIEHRVRRIEELRSWKAASELKTQSLDARSRLIGGSDAMKKVHEFIRKVAPVNSPVLLLGPSGSGKEVVAQAIHESSPRAVRPFIAINCASLNEQLMESELFGHEKGAFTGATASKPGKFELAEGGTLFLDEVGELSQELQAKLLRVLQEKEFFRVGGLRKIKSEARVIAATHRPLKDMVAEGTFREDLFFRLNVLSLALPGLDERAEDVPLLIEHFWAKLCRDFNRNLRLAPEARSLLETYSYPGNVRELQNVLERLVVLGSERGVVGPEMLPEEFRGGLGAGAPAGATGTAPAAVLGTRSLETIVEDLEKSLILEALKRTHQNQVKAAELLQISRGMLLYKLKKYGLAPGGKGSKPDTESEAA